MMKIFISLAVSIAIIACGKQSEMNSGRSLDTTPIPIGGSEITHSSGGQDSGGGDTLGSKKNFITDIFSDKPRLLNELNQILMQFEEPRKFLNENSFVKEWKNTYDSSNINLESTVNKIKIKDSCIDKQGKSTAASVSEFSIDGEICISEVHLSSIPPESLRRQIHAILFHEISHLIGYKEEKYADEIQNLILKNYNLLFSNTDSKSLSEKIFIIEMINAKLFLKGTQGIPDHDFSNGQILNDKKFLLDLATTSKFIFPMLIKSAGALLDTVESRAQFNPKIDIQKSKKSITEIINISNKIIGLKTVLDFHMAKSGDYLYIKKEFQKSLESIENNRKNLDFLSTEFEELWGYDSGGF